MFSVRPRKASRGTSVPRPAPAEEDTGHRLRAPSALHAFNRFELKYLVPRSQLEAIREELTGRMEPDPHAGPSGYGVWSVYYDTAQLRFYREKIEGLKFRRKLRIRRYGEALGELSTDGPVSVEIGRAHV